MTEHDFFRYLLGPISSIKLQVYPFIVLSFVMYKFDFELCINLIYLNDYPFQLKAE